MSTDSEIQKFNYRPAWYFYAIYIFLGINPIIIQTVEVKNSQSGYNIFATMLDKSPRMGWVFIAIFLAFSLYVLAVFYYSRGSNREIIITNTSVTAPKSLLSVEIITVDFKDILSISRPHWWYNYMVIAHKNGKLRVALLGRFNRAVIDNVFFEINSKLRSIKHQANQSS